MKGKAWEVEILDDQRNPGDNIGMAGWSIPEIYDTIKRKYESNAKRNYPGYINITYNTEYHFPEIIDFDLPFEPNSNVRIGKVIYKLSEFTPSVLE